MYPACGWDPSCSRARDMRRLFFFDAAHSDEDFRDLADGIQFIAPVQTWHTLDVNDGSRPMHGHLVERERTLLE
jgi:hypothetical protein